MKERTEEEMGAQRKRGGKRNVEEDGEFGKSQRQEKRTGEKFLFDCLSDYKRINTSAAERNIKTPR